MEPVKIYMSSPHQVDIMNNSRVGRYMDGVERRMIVQYMPSKPLCVLDLGGGTGRWSRWLLQNGHRQLLADIDRSALRSIPGRDSGLRVLQADVQHIPAADASFDAAIAIQLFDQIPDSMRFLQEVHRVLKPGGLLFLTWGNRHSIKGLLYSTYSSVRGTPQQDRRLFYNATHSDNMEKLHAANFRVLDAIGYNWGLLPRSHNSPLVNVFVAMERFLRLNKWLSISPNIVSVARRE